MARDCAFDIDAAPAAAPAADRPARSIWRRMLDHIVASRQAKAEREIERYIRMRGGQLTDDIEREIGRKFGTIVDR
jgi:hypothetical protein